MEYLQWRRKMGHTGPCPFLSSGGCPAKMTVDDLKVNGRFRILDIAHCRAKKESERDPPKPEKTTRRRERALTRPEMSLIGVKRTLVDLTGLLLCMR